MRDIEERLLATPADEIDGRVAPQPTYPVWQNVADLVIGLRMELDLPGWEREYAGTARTLGRWRGLVVLDDLGREKSTDWSGEVIYALCNHRYEQRLPTLVTSNLTPNDLALSPYWPVISRLAEDGELIEITGPDHRVDR